MKDIFYKNVQIKYQIYNSLLLGLPFKNISETGVFLPILQNYCTSGLEKKLPSNKIIDNFFNDYYPNINITKKYDLLFDFIKYIERQVVLFDAVEDSAFDVINDLTGEGTINALNKRLRYKNKFEQFNKTIEEFKLHLVLTAHPTQFYPPAVLQILRDLGHEIKNNNLDEINLLLTQLGRTAFINRDRPSVLEEATSLVWYLENVFYDSITEITKEISSIKNDFNNHDLVTVGFWAGGDRDGNPNVTPSVTKEVSQILRNSILRKYLEDVSILKRRITFKHTEKYIQELYERLYSEVFLNKTSFNSYTEILEDLNKIRDSLIKFHSSLFINLVDNLITKVNLFKIHFAQLEIRQDSRIILSVIKKIFKLYKNIDYTNLSYAEKLLALKELNVKIDTADFDDPVEKDLLEVLSTMQDIQRINGKLSCHKFIISNTQQAIDLLHILTLVKNLKLDLEINIVPLFESINDLKNAKIILEELYTNIDYIYHLKSQNYYQTVMLGFSDGTKDGGYLSANYSIYKAKEEITEISRKYKIKLAFFDGRGGPPARGGGNTHKFYSSLGSKIENNEIQLTIQGQTISSNFGTTTSAKYNIEQLITAGIEQQIFTGEIPELKDQQKNLIEKLSNISLEKYLKLRNLPNFIDYLQKVGTLDYYGKTNISSRPVKRAGQAKLTLESLRAIPFVGTWTQLKQNVPGFYGLGTAIETIGEIESIKLLYKESQFFRTLIDNCMQVLLKSNFNLTAYLAKDPEFSEIWHDIFEEFNKTVKYISIISEQNSLMQEATNKNSIILREEIVLPLLAIQQKALIDINTSQNPKIEQDLILRSMFGVINAARNSV